ncbi:MAG: hypothetical protein EXS35_08185 [Pedosphaera sp.]|nr:hypothetical protein [Pedosphaera sp.]
MLKIHIPRWLQALRCCLMVSASLSLCGLAAEWPQYRGPNHDGISSERINKQWTGSVTNPVWLVSLTNGLTSLTVSGGRVFTQVATDYDLDGQPRREFCFALSATNGAILWSTEVEAQVDPLYPNGGVGTGDDGPRSTPSVVGGSVYVLSSYHKLWRLNATNGAVIWSTNLVAGFGGGVIPWQNAASPVIENGLIFVHANCGTATLMAFSTTNGTLVWRSQNEGMTQSTPALATINGVRQLIFATQSGLVSVNPQTGALLWKFPYPFTYNTSLAASPAVYQDIVFLAAYYTMGTFAVRIVQSNSTQTATQLWFSSLLEMKNHWATPVCYQGALYGSFTPDNDSAKLKCVDLATGTTYWAANNFGRGSTLLVGTNLVVVTERGDVVLVAANTNSFTELARFQAIPAYSPDTNKCWNALALSDGQLYVRSSAFAARFDLSVPDLILDPPKLVTQTKASLLIRTVTGDPINSNRLAGLEVRASTNAALPVAQWAKLNNVPVLSNGVARVTVTDVAPPRQYFIVSEPFSAFSTPKLLLDPPQLATRSELSLAIRTATGVPIASNRLAGMEVRASTNLSLARDAWPKLTNSLVLSNGVVTVTSEEAPAPRRFFIVSEPR